MSFDLPPQAGAARDAAILNHVRSGDYSIEWAPVANNLPNGHVAVFQVFADALKIGGVRISVSATVLQQIADLLGCLLLTPKLSDLCWTSARSPILPAPVSPPSSDTATMVKESRLIDTQLNSLPAPHGLIAPIGKPWVICNALAAHPGRAALYGWQAATPLANIPLYNGVTPGIRVIQPLSTAHDANYVDYAMMCVLAGRTCLVDGLASDLAAVLQDPALAALASHEGPLRILRQPGVPPMTPLSNPPGALQNVSFEEGGGPPIPGAGARNLALIGAAAGTAGLLAGLAYFVAR